MKKIPDAIHAHALKNGTILATRGVNDHEILGLAAVRLARMGYLVNPTMLVHADIDSVLSAAQKLSGSDRPYESFYPNFPHDVMERTAVELLVDQLIHYLSGGELIPAGDKVSRDEIDSSELFRNAVRLDTVMATASYISIQLKNYERSNVSVDSDGADFIAAAMVYVSKDKALNFITSCANGENAYHGARALFARSFSDKREMFAHLCASADNTDRLLRYILAVYGMPVRTEDDFAAASCVLSNSLAFAVKFAPMPNVSRKAIVSALSRLVDSSRDFSADRLLSRKALWKKVAISIHPFSLKLDDNARFVFDVLMGNRDYETFESAVESALSAHDVSRALGVLHARPGSLLRRLLHLVRSCESTADADKIVCTVRSVSRVRVSTAVSAYNALCAPNTARVTAVGGQANHVRAGNDYTDAQLATISRVLEELESLIVRSFDTSGDATAVAAGGGNFPMPLALRDASRGRETLYRGQTIATFDDSDTLRLFVSWFNVDNSNTDIDLACAFFDKDFALVGNLGWNSRGQHLGTYSGDITNAPRPRGAAEFIDVSVETLKSYGVAYVVPDVRAYSGNKLADVDHRAGAMVRTDVLAGEEFDARTLVQSYSSTSLSTNSIPFVVDVSAGRVAWVDTSTGQTSGGSSLLYDFSARLVVQNIMAPAMTVEKFARLYARATGAEVDMSATADIEFLHSLLS